MRLLLSSKYQLLFHNFHIVTFGFLHNIIYMVHNGIVYQWVPGYVELENGHELEISSITIIVISHAIMMMFLCMLNLLFCYSGLYCGFVCFGCLMIFAVAHYCDKGCLNVFGVMTFIFVMIDHGLGSICAAMKQVLSCCGFYAWIR